MSGNTSATGGYLLSTSLSPEDDDLVDLFQGLVVGLTGLDPTLVRPRWQPQPPTQPAVTTNWCAIGVTKFEAIDYPQMVLDPATNYTTVDMGRLERIDLIASFYGPNATSTAGSFRDGLYVAQNLYVLSQQGIKMRSADDMVYVPELINSQWIPRSDLHCSFMRMLGRVYPIEQILSASVQVTANTDQGDMTCTETIEENS